MIKETNPCPNNEYEISGSFKLKVKIPPIIKRFKSFVRKAFSDE